MKYAGIDYSLSCPAMTVYDDDSNSYSFYYLYGIKSRVYDDINVHGKLLDTTSHSVSKDISDMSIHSSISRFTEIATFFLNVIRQEKVEVVFLEGYSLGSKGKVFSIAEHTAILKKTLYDNGVDTVIIPPTVIKKFATGKGNAKKEMMVDWFEKSEDVSDHIKQSLAYTQGKIKDTSPYTDLVDSYWTLMTGLNSF